MAISSKNSDESWPKTTVIYSLPSNPDLPSSISSRLIEDYERFKYGLPVQIEDYVREAYEIDLSSEYAGKRIKNPFGKASGQLSLATHQIEKDAESGLGFVVLKTVIAQNENGFQSMQDWAIKESHMLVERIQARSGRTGWTVTWKGRGWHESFSSYLDFFGAALEVARAARMLVVPSCKYHLPQSDESLWRDDEYQFTTRALVEIWRDHGWQDEPMPLEKDFSPTLAGSPRASQKETILEWLQNVPRLIRQSVGVGSVTVGLKIFNAMFDDDFQLEMLRVVHQPDGKPADFLVYANRLFDPTRTFEGKVGVAYGGPDLSDRNLRILQRWPQSEGAQRTRALPISGTGDICSGKRAVEYLLRGCSSFQMHTVFQLPDSEYAMTSGHKTQRTLHQLYFHPSEGFLAWIWHLRRTLGCPEWMNVGDLAHYCAAPQDGIPQRKTSVTRVEK